MSQIEQFIGKGVELNFDPDLKRAFDFEDNTVDESIRKPENVRLDKEHLRVSGDCVFYTIQGEGKTMGMPCVFLRLHVCNLRCVWCDAWYTWNPKTSEFWTESKQWTIQETAENIDKTWKAPSHVERRLIITGGEPLLQKDQIDKLIDLLPGYKIEIETNGTIMPTEKQLAVCQFNCSPKLSNSLNVRQARIQPAVLKAIAQADSVFKFVVMKVEDIQEIERDFMLELGIPHEKVIIMPQGVTAKEVHTNAIAVVEYVKEKGFRMMGRLQNEIWGAKRGV